MPLSYTGLSRFSAGFTLIEVLVAVFVLASGILGLAALQAASLRNNQSAYYRSQATQLAYDMADRLRANIRDANDLASSTYVTLLPEDAEAQSACTQVSTTCTPAIMAEQDLFQWNQDIVAMLPGGTGTITVNAATRVFSIAIRWDENRDGNTDNNDPSFQMSFQP